MIFYTFFQNGLGQQRFGIENTVEELYNYYLDKKPNTRFIENTLSLENNLTKLYFENSNIIELKNNININIGGDHSMAIGSIAASLNVYGLGLKVIWIDAHADINTKSSSPSGNVHGMPLSFLTGLESDHNYNFINTKLSFENIFYIGIRDLDDLEVETIEKFHIKKVLSEDFNNSNYDVTSDIIDWIGDSPVHLSIDVDGLDPVYMEYTGTKVPNGLELPKLIDFLNQLVSKKNIVNVDITELNLFNPECDENLLNKQISFESFDQIFETIDKNL